MSRTLAIGDIHGCLTALRTLADIVAFHDDDTLITLGDDVEERKGFGTLFQGSPLGAS